MPDPSTPPGWNNPNDPPSGEQPPYGQSGQPYGGSSGYGSGYGQAPTPPPGPSQDSAQGSAQAGPDPTSSGTGWGQNQQGYPTPPTYPGQANYLPPAQAPTGATDPDDLTLPLYGASFVQAVKRFYKKYATFSGRASRSEYWWVTLYTGLVSVVFATAMTLVGLWVLRDYFENRVGVEGSQQPYTDGKWYYEDYDWTISGAQLTLLIVVGAITVIWGLAHIIPQISLTWRRLHDANFAGPFYFLTFTSIGSLVVFVMTLLPSRPEGQRFDSGNQPSQLPPGGYGQSGQYQPGGYSAPPAAAPQGQAPQYGQPGQNPNPYGQQGQY
jgi:uncharacterized membrane protein YhaH (DUF805 family)